NVAVRHAAADGLSEMGVRAAGREAEIAAALLTAARREGDSTARPHLVAAAYLRGSEAAQNELRPTLHQWVLDTAADGRPQVITVMGIAGAVEELPRLIERLGDGDAEVRVAAAAAVLRLGRHAPRRLAALDWMVIGIYGVGMLAVGWHYSRRTATTDDYLLGGR